jgi:hypothetical protein
LTELRGEEDWTEGIAVLEEGCRLEGKFIEFGGGRRWTVVRDLSWYRRCAL